MHEIVHALTGGCLSPFEPFCKKGRCTTPSCNDAQPYCSRPSRAGAAARVYCPVTCGCHDAFSLHPWTDFLKPEFGCPASCSDKRAQKLAARSCADAKVGSAAMTAYGQALIDSGNGLQSLGQAIVDYGCRTVGRSDFGREVVCMYEPLQLLHHQASLRLFCPVACGCRGGEPGCPASCPANRPLAAAGNSTP